MFNNFKDFSIMPDPKNYFEFLDLADGSRWYARDAEAQADIARILEILQNGSRYIGKFTSAVVGGETVDVLHQGDVVTSITTSKGTYVTGTPASGQKQLLEGDYCQYERTGQNAIEWMWNGDNIDEFGSTSMLKALAFKDSATGSYTPAGTNGSSTVSFAEGTGSNFVTGYNDDAVADSFVEGAFTPAAFQSGFYSAGSAASFSEGAFTPAAFQAGFYSEGTAPSFSEGAFTPAEIQSGFVTPGSAATFSEGAFSAGSLPSLTPVSGENGLAFSAGTLPSKAADTFNGGAPTVIDTTKFSGGSKAADSFSAGSVTTIDTTKFSGGSKAADTFVANTPTVIDTTKFSGGSKAADTFTPGSAATLAVAKAITASDTGTAAAQTFTGTAGTVTVS